MERRAFIASELRAATGRKIKGVAAKYDVLSRDLGGFKERIKRGAFASAIRSGQDVKFLFNHNPSAILGSTKAGTLSLRDTSTGLEFEADMPDTTVGRDTYESIKRGDINSCSFSFALGARSDEEWGDELDQDEDNPMAVNKGEHRSRIKVRNLINIPNLFDVSAVTYPAYPNGTSVDARSAELRSYMATLDIVETEPVYVITQAELRGARALGLRHQFKRDREARIARRRDLLNIAVN
jgi:HK97 family phage prohead protease